MKYEWLRLHHDIWQDQKMNSLADAEFRLWVGLLVLASQSKPRGVISGIGGRAAQARCLYTTEQALEAALTVFSSEAYGMVTLLKDGAIAITHWTERQYDKPSDAPEATSGRKREQRRRKEEQPQQPKLPEPKTTAATRPKSHANVPRMSRARHATDTDTESSSYDDEQRQNDVANATSTDPECARAVASSPAPLVPPAAQRVDVDDVDDGIGDQESTLAAGIDRESTTPCVDSVDSVAEIVTGKVTDLWQQFDAWKALRPGEFLRRLECEYPVWLPYLGRLLHEAKAAKRSRGESIHLEVPYLKGIALDYLPDILAGKCPPPEGDSSSDGQHGQPDEFASELAPNRRGASRLGGAAAGAASGGRRSGASVGGAIGRGRAGAAEHGTAGARGGSGPGDASGDSKRRYTSADAKPF